MVRSRIALEIRLSRSCILASIAAIEWSSSTGKWSMFCLQLVMPLGCDPERLITRAQNYLYEK